MEGRWYVDSEYLGSREIGYRLYSVQIENSWRVDIKRAKKEKRGAK